MKKVRECEIIPKGFSYRRVNFPESKCLQLMITFQGYRFYVKIENNRKYEIKLMTKNSFGHSETLIEPRNISKSGFNLIVKSFREFAEFVDNRLKDKRLKIKNPKLPNIGLPKKEVVFPPVMSPQHQLDGNGNLVLK